MKAFKEEPSFRLIKEKSMLTEKKLSGTNKKKKEVFV